MTVHLLTIEHRYGTDHYACATQEIATAKLDEFVQRWWPTEIKDESPPEDRNQRIERYFDALASRGGHEEYWSIEKLEVIE